MTGCSSGASSMPKTGLSQFAMKFVGPRMRPRKAEPTASTIIGMVIVSGDSCGWTSSVHRFLPRKVMK